MLARPDRLTRRISRFATRHRVAVAAAGAALVALALGGATTLWQANQARLERARVAQRMEDVRELTTSLIFDIDDAITDVSGAFAARQMIFQRGFGALEDLAEEAQGDPDLRWELAEAFLRVGMVQGQPVGPNLGDLAGVSCGRGADAGRAVGAAASVPVTPVPRWTV